MPSRDVALFVDWDNLKIELNKKGQSPTLSRLWELSEEHGRLVVAKAYADWTARYDLRRDQFDLYVAGIEPVFVPCRTPDRGWIKNSVDVKMSADCLDVSYQNPNVKVFVLVSGDVDFLHVAESLRRRGLQVVVIGVRGSTSSRLGDGVDARKFYDDAPAIPSAAPVATIDMAPVFEAMRNVLRGQREAGDYPVNFANFKPLLKAAMPNGFEETAYGATKFKQVVMAAQKAGVVRIVTQNLINWAVLPEDGPAPVSLEEPDTPANPSPAHEIVTTDEILTELVCTYVELALKNLPFISMGRVQQFALMRGRKAAEDMTDGFSHSAALEGITKGAMGKHIANAIKEGVFEKIQKTSDDGSATVAALHLGSDHPIVQEVLNRPAKDV